ncbi:MULTISPECIES: NmrA family NAD(P)-binding protein [Sinorhizobium]|uniref:NmrA family transcriptional regulator n=1 Tax=Sinorhizobium americanum TaxID=194963 RepID=A0A2S3YQ17_9HYPH|nr:MULTISPECIES: NmrA family NAD(P)-binding protein [Sinorhizobium]PDT43047.1 NmrA family transcriptional regulator [Sinorhizobium sp. FG01]POH32961.1 NmrA family transcriptional regulator [Sinorhizobium americanum]
MFIVIGANGHVGSAVVSTLLDAGRPVTAVLHSSENDADWRNRGAQTAVVDVHNTHDLRAVFRTGTRAFLLNPNADVSTDTDREEHATVRSIVAALKGSGLEKVVAASTYGAQPGERCGDLNILYDFEQALAAQPIPATIQRGAYYMSNWDELLDAARDGVLPTMIPADMKIPMVAPADLGKAAVRHLLEPPRDQDVHYVEGPERYSPQDVAKAFATALGNSVKVEVIPRDQWIAAYRRLGFSDAAAESYARMTAVSVESGFAMLEPFERGETTLEEYVGALVASRAARTPGKTKLAK